MSSRLSLLLTIVFVASFALAQSPLQHSPMDFGYRAGLSGTVRDASGHPVPNARVEVQDSMTGRSVSAVYTAPNGNFEVFDLPRGQYEVVASVGIYQSRTRLDLDMPRELDFRLSMNQADATGGSTEAVSLSQMKVPGKARKLFQKAMDAFRAAHLDDAFNLVQKALTSCPDYAQALTLRGILHLQKGDTQSAQPDLEKAVELDYANDVSFVALASLYNTEGKYDQALKVLDRGMGLHPNSWQGWMETGRADIGLKKYDDGLKALARMERYVPQENDYLYLYRAQAFIGLKNYPAAISQLETFLAHEKSGPNVETAQNTLTQLRGVVVEEAKK